MNATTLNATTKPPGPEASVNVMPIVLTGVAALIVFVVLMIWMHCYNKSAQAKRVAQQQRFKSVFLNRKFDPGPQSQQPRSTYMRFLVSLFRKRGNKASQLRALDLPRRVSNPTPLLPLQFMSQQGPRRSIHLPGPVKISSMPAKQLPGHQETTSSGSAKKLRQVSAIGEPNKLLYAPANATIMGDEKQMEQGGSIMHPMVNKDLSISKDLIATKEQDTSKHQSSKEKQSKDLVVAKQDGTTKEKTADGQKTRSKNRSASKDHNITKDSNGPKEKTSKERKHSTVLSPDLGLNWSKDHAATKERAVNEPKSSRRQSKDLSTLKDHNITKNHTGAKEKTHKDKGYSKEHTNGKDRKTSHKDHAVSKDPGTSKDHTVTKDHTSKDHTATKNRQASKDLIASREVSPAPQPIPQPLKAKSHSLPIYAEVKKFAKVGSEHK